MIEGLARGAYGTIHILGIVSRDGREGQAIGRTQNSDCFLA
jgi:hypothetical protein